MPPGRMFIEPSSRRSRTSLTDDGVQVSIPARRHVPLLLFHAVWLVAWLVGGSMAIPHAFGDTGGPGLFLKAWLLLWAGAAVSVFFACAWTLRGREIVTRRADRLTLKRDLFGMGRTREFDRAAITNMRVVPVTSPFESRAIVPIPGMAIGRVAFDYGATTVRFADAVDEVEAALIVQELGSHASNLLTPAATRAPESTPPPAGRGFQRRMLRVLLRLTVTAVVIVIVFAALIWGGPLLSGGLMLGWPAAAHPIEHKNTITPVHKGYVDLSTGIYVREDDDIVLTKGVPFALHRSYMSGDRQTRPFGIGTSSNADWYIVGDVDGFQWAAVILANGARIRFTRTSTGTSYVNARFEHRETATFFYGSQLAWNGLGWTLRLADGTIHKFSGCSPTARRGCSLIETRDPDGHVLKFVRGADEGLRAIEGTGERMTLQYDESGRVVAITNGYRDLVRYVYDTAGRLEKATMEDGVVRRYSYGPHDELVKIEEPGRVIENTFNADSRLVRQVLHRQGEPDYEEEWAYTAVDGTVSETVNTDIYGQRTVLRWDEDRNQIFESRELPPWQPATMTFNRSEGGFLRSVTVRCVGPKGRVDGTYAIPATNYNAEDYKDYLFERLCGVPES